MGLRCQPGEIPKPVTYRVRSFITLPNSQRTLANGSTYLHIALFRQRFYTASAMQGPALSRRCRALKVLSPSAWDVSIRAAAPSLVGNIAASVRSPHQYPCVHLSRRIPRKGHGQRRARWVLTTPEASPRSFLPPRLGHCLPAWCPCRPIFNLADWVVPEELHLWAPVVAWRAPLRAPRFGGADLHWRAGPLKDWLDGIGLAARHDARRMQRGGPPALGGLAAEDQGPRHESSPRDTGPRERARPVHRAGKLSGVGISLHRRLFLGISL